MTRIIAGRLGGRTIATPRGAATRPTTERVREALFSRVAALVDLDGARVLDLYAGSGALGLESLSRGAAQLLAVEKHRPTAALAERNARTLGLDGSVQVQAAPVERVLRGGPGAGGAEDAYDLVLLDPPYPLDEDGLATVLALLVDHGWLAPDALVVVERSVRSPEPRWPAGLAPLGSRSYGETALHLAEPAPHTPL
ncbi:16S rRNA (guanine(966)-N(2))-methyltransferase RsmD [Ornithinimicrobium avium]|uniref:16S rRNA (Guanine(966)-N(2))-methyltransferase RsmD n=1 Tax=Ornithinimicrobium avium TaxID=2283195 RepID=A0A345NIJ8_9MICO|nr:16S rRNA (guanine(966)-N(2))-methyltransferase RsmD [Ornithinimicrobium avium]AXH94856.1 16S rRNA (guanine(966)-N(2))-methyltransferase RsmD [Ornithinimicrobium avium]